MKEKTTKVPIVILHSTALINRTLVPDAAILISNGRIAMVGKSKQIHIPSDARKINAKGKFVVPGFIDIHIHGSGGCRAEDDVIGIAKHIIRNGTTWFLPTFISNNFDKMLEAIDHVRSCTERVSDGATIGGIHLEGPFLNPKYGAQRSEANIEPEPHRVKQLIERCGKSLRLVTIAPERRGAIAAIKAFRAAGAIVSIGHSDATEAEYLAGRAAGITHATHLFNAMPPKVWPTTKTYNGTKLAGIEEFILADDGISADILCDATAAHVHPSLLKTALRCKGPEKLSLITDAMMAAGLPDGKFTMADGQNLITSPDEDVARLEGGGLCGSVMSMCGAVRNFIHHTGVPLEVALTMVSEAPARTLGIFKRKGSIAAGKDADLVFLDKELNVESVMIGGKIKFSREKEAS